MRVIVYDAEWNRYRHENIQFPALQEAEDLGRKMDLDRLTHSSLLPSLDSRTAFHPGGGRQWYPSRAARQRMQRQALAKRRTPTAR